MTSKYATIPLLPKTKEILNTYKIHKRETYDDLINRLLEELKNGKR